MFHTPVDVFCDTLLFLKRKEIAQSQIACRTWNKIINQYNGILPLHRIYSITIRKEKGQLSDVTGQPEIGGETAPPLVMPKGLYVQLYSTDRDDTLINSLASNMLLDDLKREPFRIIFLKYCIFETMNTRGVDYNSLIDVNIKQKIS